jgi:hypothetical protein
MSSILAARASARSSARRSAYEKIEKKGFIIRRQTASGEKVSQQKQCDFTFQSGGFIAKPNKLGAKVDEMLHQRLLRSNVRKQVRKRQTRQKVKNIDGKRKIDMSNTK